MIHLNKILELVNELLIIKAS